MAPTPDIIKSITVLRDGHEFEIEVGKTYRSSYGNVFATVTKFTTGGENLYVDYTGDPRIDGEVTVPISWLSPLHPLEQLAETA